MPEYHRSRSLRGTFGVREDPNHAEENHACSRSCRFRRRPGLRRWREEAGLLEDHRQGEERSLHGEAEEVRIRLSSQEVETISVSSPPPWRGAVLLFPGAYPGAHPGRRRASIPERSMQQRDGAASCLTRTARSASPDGPKASPCPPISKWSARRNRPPDRGRF